MRVLFLTHRLPYAPNRGDRIRAYHLLRAIAPHAKIDLLSLVHDTEEANEAQQLNALVDSIHLARVPHLRNTVRCLPALATTKPLTHVLLDSPDVGPALQTLRARRPDVVLAYCSGMAQYLFTRALADLPAVIDMVDVDSAKWADLATAAWLPQRWIFQREAKMLGRFEASATARAFATLTVNERERRALAVLAPSARIEAVENGIDQQYFHPAEAPCAEPVVVFCGVMSYAPNQQGLLWMAQRVWPQVRSSCPGAKLVIVGSDPGRLIRRLHNPEAGITITGKVSDVRPFLWNAAVAIAPLAISHGLQNKVLEAVASGLPCVVTQAVAEGLPTEALLACRVANEPQQFAVEILNLLNMPARDRRAVATGAALTRLGWESRLGAVVRLLREASETRR